MPKPRDAVRAEVDDTLDDPVSRSRAAFLGKAVVASGALAGGGLLLGGVPRLAASAPSPAQDVRILNFALLLEYLGAAFYAEARKKGALKGELLQFAQLVGGHEEKHVAFLRNALGAKARKKPSFNFGRATSDPKRFVTTAITLEDTGVAAYNGQATNLTASSLAAAAKIVSVEARHAAWIRDIAGKTPAANATDAPKTEAQVMAVLKSTGFLESS